MDMTREGLIGQDEVGLIGQAEGGTDWTWRGGCTDMTREGLIGQDEGGLIGQAERGGLIGHGEGAAWK